MCGCEVLDRITNLFKVRCILCVTYRNYAIEIFKFTMPETRELLSRHVTRGTYDGPVNIPCRFRTSLCPDRCGHGGQAVKFTVNYHYVSFVLNSMLLEYCCVW